MTNLELSDIVGCTAAVLPVEVMPGADPTETAPVVPCLVLRQAIGVPLVIAFHHTAEKSSEVALADLIEQIDRAAAAAIAAAHRINSLTLRGSDPNA